MKWWLRALSVFWLMGIATVFAVKEPIAAACLLVAALLFGAFVVLVHWGIEASERL